MGEDLYRLLTPKFELAQAQYPGQISEVRLGNTAPEGTRANFLILGGSRDFPYFINKKTSYPHIAMQIQIPPENISTELARSLSDYLDDPVEWARFCIKECSAEAIQVKFNLQNGEVNDRVIKEIKETSRLLVDNIKVPLIFSGPENKDVEPLILEAASSVTKGERVLLASARLDNDHKRIAQAAISDQHVVLASTDCDPPSQKILNDKLLDYGLSNDQIVIDPTTAALGYGLEYSLSITEQIRLNALKGDQSLQMPIVAFPVNSWTAREANPQTTTQSSTYSIGVIWELTTALVMFLAGADLLVIIHPETVKQIRYWMAEAKSTL